MVSLEGSLYRTAYCSPNGVLIIEGSLYRTAHCGSNGVHVVVVVVSLLGRFHFACRTAYYGPNDVLI